MNDNEIITEGELFDYLEEVIFNCPNSYIVRVPVSGPLTILSNKDNIEIEEYELLISDSGKRGWRKRARWTRI